MISSEVRGSRFPRDQLARPVRSEAMARAAPRMLDDGDELTQYGDNATVPCFHVAPDPSEDELSLIAGHLNPAEACARVRVRGCSRQHATCTVRYVGVGRLRGEGFRVENTPTRMNGDHCSVWWDDVPEGEWPLDVSERFDSCFDSGKEGQDV